MAVTVDPWDEGDLGVWPALWEDRDVLEGRYLRVRNDTRTMEGFLVAVDGLRGGVTLRLEGEETVIPGAGVASVFRRAYTGLEMTDVFIYRTVLKDVYVSVLGVQPLEDGTYVATVTVMEVPAIAFLWAGLAMMSLGILVRPLEAWDPARGAGGPPGGDGDEDETRGGDEEADDDGDGGGDGAHEGEGLKTDEDDEGER
jgi:hypothetical protein